MQYYYQEGNGVKKNNHENLFIIKNIITIIKKFEIKITLKPSNIIKNLQI